MPRGKTVSIGWVDSGQSIDRPTTTASLFVFHRVRVHISGNLLTVIKCLQTFKLERPGLYKEPVGFTGINLAVIQDELLYGCVGTKICFL